MLSTLLFNRLYVVVSYFAVAVARVVVGAFVFLVLLLLLVLLLHLSNICVT